MQGRQKSEVGQKGTYTTQNFIFKTLVVFYSITKEISEMDQLEREKWFSEVLQKHKSSVISVMSENDRKVLLIIRDFHTK